ncbi:MAG: M50 family metallopeptidase [bacterium]
MEVVSILLVILAFFLIILFHEFGHYLGCRIVNVKVEEFSIGLGKEIWSKKIGETKYTLRLLPIGGYVLPEGEEYKKDQPLSETNFYSKPLWARFIVIVLGPIFNYIFALLIFLLVFSFYDYKVTTEIMMVVNNTPAQKAGLKAGDIITQIDSISFGYYEGKKLIEYIHNSKGKLLNITIKRGTQTITYRILPEYNAQQNFYYIGFNPKKSLVIEFNFLRGVRESIFTTYDLTVRYLKVIVSIFTGHIPLKTVYEQSAGPIGITKIMYDFANQGIYNYLMLVGFINIVIGLFNLLPFPALDGGRILFIGINYILGMLSLLFNRKIEITPDKEEMFHKVGLVLLLVFVAIVSYNDIARIIRGESFIK